MGGDVVVCEKVGVEGVAEMGGGVGEDGLDRGPGWAGGGGCERSGSAAEGERRMVLVWMGLWVLPAGAPGVA